MRICVLGPVDSIHTHNWVGSLSERGDEVTYINISDRPRQIPGATVVDVGGVGPLRLRARRAAIRNLRPDIVHQHAVATTLGNLALWRTPSLVVSAWGTDVAGESRSPLARWLQRFLLAQAAAITATSRFLAEATAQLAPKGARIEVVPFGVDCEQFSADRPPSGRNGVTVAFVKHLEPLYGPDVLLKAFANLALRRADVRLIMVGEGSMRPRLVRQAEELGVVERVSFLGAVNHDEVPSILARTDIFAMPSVCREGFGVAAIEASAMEVPVVASDTGGIPEAVRDGETGLLVPPGDADALESALERLIQDRELRERMGRQGRKWVLSRYTWEESVSAMQKLYREVSAGGSR